MKKYVMSLIIIMLLVTSCSNEPSKIKLGTMPTYSAAIYAVGIEQGFFEDAGVEVELTVFRSARDRDGAATAGQLDGFMTDIMGAVQLNQSGFPFMITSREYDDFAIMANGSVDLSDLGQAKLGLSENTVIEYIADTYLEVEAVKVPVVAVPDRMGALLNEELDLGIFPQPFVGIIMGKGGQIVFSTASDDFHPVVLVFDQTYMEDHLDSVQAFYQGYMKTIAYMQSTDYDEYKMALVTHGLATEENVDFYRLPVDLYGFNQVQVDDVESVLTWMSEKELLKEVLSYDQLVKKIEINP